VKLVSGLCNNLIVIIHTTFFKLLEIKFQLITKAVCVSLSYSRMENECLYHYFFVSREILNLNSTLLFDGHAAMVCKLY
jgi:hypothetical protein